MISSKDGHDFARRRLLTGVALALAAPALGRPAVATSTALAKAHALSSRQAVSGFSPANAPERIGLAGFANAGDGGGAIYARVNREPAHKGKFAITLADGKTRVWYEIAETELRPQMFGAQPEADARTNTLAFQALSGVINAWGGGAILISGGRFSVFFQTVNPEPDKTAPYYGNGGNVLGLSKCDGLRIRFAPGAELKAADGLRYGAFDPLTGKAFKARGRRFTKKPYLAAFGSFISLHQCTRVRIENARLDGNNTRFVNGGHWGTRDRQISANGISMIACKGVLVTDFDIHHCGLDGIYLTGKGAQHHMGIELRDGRCAYNGRQGMSWTGGFGLVARGCTFGWTGYGGVLSGPGAGLDIEHNRTPLGNGLFVGCTFVHCKGYALLNPSPSGGTNIRFVDCLVQNGAGRRALESKQPMSFERCTFHGNIVNVSQCAFTDCRFTNKPYADFGPGPRMFMDVNDPAVFRRCAIESVKGRDYNFNIRGGARMESCRFVFSQQAPSAGVRLGILGCHVIDCAFEQDFADPSAVEPEGRHAYVDNFTSGPATLSGHNTISGDGLAWGGKGGAQNTVLPVNGAAAARAGG